MRNLIILMALTTTATTCTVQAIDTIEGEKVTCERYLDSLVRCSANGMTCYEDEETGDRQCFKDLATIKL